mmetsp:Transcript_14269/g.36981  ORF Transcript_14269/g.36981 Transcript_14269/m.36981 type:complete len:246 (-) Transcript_14269:112-849(-)
MNSSTESFANSSGYSGVTDTSAISSRHPMPRAMMSALRATSTPPRSSRGSGSVYPRPLASSTISEKGRPCCSPVITYPSVPEKVPATRETGSCAALSRCSAAITGSPAPTVDSWRTRCMWRAGVPTRASYVACVPEKGFLFAHTTRLPLSRARLSAGTVSSVAVQSTMIVSAPRLFTRLRRKSAADWPDSRATTSVEFISLNRLPSSLAFIASRSFASESDGATRAPDESATRHALSHRPYVEAW